MSLRNHMIPNERRLEVVRAMIRDAGMARDSERVTVLKGIADELQARCPGRQREAVEAFEQQFAATRASLTGVNYAPGQLQRLGHMTLQYWPLLRQALEAFQQGEQR